MNKEKQNSLTTWIIAIAVVICAVWHLSSCNKDTVPYDPEVVETDPSDSFEISEPALHPDCANNPGAIDPVDLWGKDEITEIVFRIDSIDQVNQRVWCEPVWSETGQTVCTGNEWRDYGHNEFTIACKETFEPYVEDTCA